MEGIEPVHDFDTPITIHQSQCIRDTPITVYSGYTNYSASRYTNHSVYVSVVTLNHIVAKHSLRAKVPYESLRRKKS